MSACTGSRAPPSGTHRRMQHRHSHPGQAPAELPRHGGIRIPTRASTTSRSGSVSWRECGASARMSEPGRKSSFGRLMSRKLSRGVSKAAVEEDAEQLTFEAAEPEHVVFLANGIWGSAKNWIFAVKVLKEKLGEKVLIHCSAANGGWKTHAGVDVMGHRLAKEVMEVVKAHPGVTKISFVSHSLGGIITRYAIGQLYAPPGGRSLLEMREGGSGGSGRGLAAGATKGTIAGLEPINFITLATPHLGCRGNNHLPFLFGVEVLEWAASLVSHLIIGRTGRHLFLADGHKDRQPLLKRMVQDSEEEGRFISALGSFKRRVAYANVSNDRMVGWRTASIRKTSEMPEPLREPEEAQKELLKNYKYIVREEPVPLADKTSSEPKDAPAFDEYEEVMVAGLQQVPWHRVDVNFSNDDALFEAHNLIQVKNEASHKRGECVIRHIIDNYFGNSAGS